MIGSTITEHPKVHQMPWVCVIGSGAHWWKLFVPPDLRITLANGVGHEHLQQPAKETLPVTHLPVILLAP